MTIAERIVLLERNQQLFTKEPLMNKATIQPATTITPKINLTITEFERLALLSAIDVSLYCAMTDRLSVERSEVIDKMWSSIQTIHHKAMSNPEAIALIGKGRSPMLETDSTIMAEVKEMLHEPPESVNSVVGTETDIEEVTQPVPGVTVAEMIEDATPSTTINIGEDEQIFKELVHEYQVAGSNYEDAVKFANAEMVRLRATRNQPNPNVHLAPIDPSTMSQSEYSQRVANRRAALNKIDRETVKGGNNG